MLLTIGSNSKLSKKVGVFNLLRVITCPGRTELCSKLCYAKKAEVMYKAVREMRKRNVAASKQSDFVDKLVAEIKDNKLEKVRMHEDGDFYCQAYLDKVIEVCRQCPDVTFLAYTRSFHLDWSYVPKNFVVYYSMDKTTRGTAPKGRRAHMVVKGDKPPAGYVTCAPSSAHNYCGDSCTRCWKGVGRIFFHQH
jgi:hypothetical protein